jgi:hypothetical protein
VFSLFQSGITIAHQCVLAIVLLILLQFFININMFLPIIKKTNRYLYRSLEMFILYFIHLPLAKLCLICYRNKENTKRITAGIFDSTSLSLSPTYSLYTGSLKSMDTTKYFQNGLSELLEVWRMVGGVWVL